MGRRPRSSGVGRRRSGARPWRHPNDAVRAHPVPPPLGRFPDADHDHRHRRHGARDRVAHARGRPRRRLHRHRAREGRGAGRRARRPADGPPTAWPATSSSSPSRTPPRPTSCGSTATTSRAGHRRHHEPGRLLVLRAAHVTPFGSGRQVIADVAPDGARVVKAFNTTFAGTLSPGAVAGQPLDVFLAGDDDEAKATVAGARSRTAGCARSTSAARPRPRARGARLPAHGGAAVARHGLRLGGEDRVLAAARAGWARRLGLAACAPSVSRSPSPSPPSRSPRAGRATTRARRPRPRPRRPRARPARPPRRTSARRTSSDPDAGTLTVGTDKPAFPPYFEDDDPTNGKGFESAVAYAIAKKLGFAKSEVKWTIVPFNSSYAPGPKDFDFDVNQISITPARAEGASTSRRRITRRRRRVVARRAPTRRRRRRSPT